MRSVEYRMSEVPRRAAGRPRVVTTLGASLAAALLTAACSGSGGEQSNHTTVRLIAPLNTPIEKMAQDYNASQTAITVKVIPAADTNAILPQLASSDAPDLYATGLGAGDPGAALELSKKGLLADLSSEPWMKRLPKVFRAGAGDSKGTYVFPLSYGMIGTIYNKDAFAKAGVQLPKNLGELYTACGLLRSAGYIPLTYSGKETPFFLGFAIAASQVFGHEPDFSELQAQGKRTFAGSIEWKNSLTLFKTLQGKGCVDKDVVGLSNDDTLKQVSTGKAAMTVTVIELLKTVEQQNPSGHYGLFPFPGDDDATKVTVPLGSGAGYGIPSKSHHQDAARQFLRWLYTPERVREYAKGYGALPTIDVETSDPGLPPSAADMKDKLAARKTTVYINQKWPNGTVMRVYIASIQQVLTGQASPEQALKDMDGAYSQ